VGAVGVAAFLAYELNHLSGFVFGNSTYSISDYDEGVYMETGALMAHGYKLFSQIYSAQPPIFPTTIAAAYKLAGTGAVQARIVLLLFGLLLLVGCALTAGQVRGWVAAGTAVFLLGISPEFLVYSHAIEEEVPMSALTVLSLALAIIWWRRDGLLPACASGLLLGLAVLTKFFAFALLLPLVLLVAVALWDRRDNREEVRLLLRDVLGFVLSALLPVAVSFAAFGGSEWAQMVGDRITATNKYSSVAPPQSLSSNLHQILSFGGTDAGLMIIAFAGGILLLLNNWRLGLVIDGWALSTLLLLARYHPLMGHHPVVILAPAAVLGGVAVSYLWPGSGSVPVEGSFNSEPMLPSFSGLRRASTMIAGVGLVLYVLLVPRLVIAYPTLLVHGTLDDRQLAATWLREKVPPGNFIASADPLICVDADRLCVPGLVDTSYIRMASGKLTSAQAIHDTIAYRAAAVAMWQRFRPSPKFPVMAVYARWVHGHYEVARAFSCGKHFPTKCDAIYVRR
jgi:Dolichyl-phosphate-mannose-protein mannosyltransferase